MHLMKMAARYDSVLADKIKEDPIIETLTARKEKFALARRYLTDSALSAFFFVLNAEKLPILETARAVDLLGKHGVFVGGMVINKVIPKEAGAFFEKRRSAQESYMADINSRFSSFIRVELPLLDSDIQGVEQLETMVPLLGALDAAGT
jgi:arsenite-transporting ATPase